MNALELATAFRGALAITGMVRSFMATANQDQVRAFLDGVRASGGDGVIGIDDVQAVLADVKASGAELDKKLGGG